MLPCLNGDVDLIVDQVMGIVQMSRLFHVRVATVESRSNSTAAVHYPRSSQQLFPFKSRRVVCLDLVELLLVALEGNRIDKDGNNSPLSAPTCKMSLCRCSVCVDEVPESGSSAIFSFIVDNLSSICSISTASVSKTCSPSNGAVAEVPPEPTLLIETSFRSISFSRWRAAFLRSVDDFEYKRVFSRIRQATHHPNSLDT